MEKAIKDCTFDENVDYIIQNIKHSSFVGDNLDYLVEVMEYIRLGNPEQIGDPEVPDENEDIANSPDEVGYLLDGKVKTDKNTIICERKLPWLKEPYRLVDGHYMPNIICLDEVTNRVLERYCEPRGSSDEASHEYTYNGTTIRWLKRECQ